MTERTVRVGTRETRYLEAGSGRAVLFAPGLGLSADFYKPNIAALADAGFRAIACDLPGFGRSNGNWFGSSVSEIAAHLVGFAEAVGIGRAAWIGHSIGCQAALRIAADHPQLAEALILSGPTGGGHRRLLQQAAAIAYHAVHEPWRLLRAVIHDYARTTPCTYLGTWIKAARDHPLAAARRVNCPVLVAVGTRDRVARADFLAQLMHALPNGTLVKLPGGQHGLPLDSEGLFNHAVIDFLRAARAKQLNADRLG